MLKNNKGITLIALVVTIVVLLIISGITITGSIRGIDESKDNTLLSELEIVQHAIVERYTKYKLTKDASLLVGEVVVPEALPEEGKSWKLSQEEIGTDTEKQYRKLESTHLEALGLDAGSHALEDTYIVNYYTGEVYNFSRQTITNGELLYRTMQ